MNLIGEQVLLRAYLQSADRSGHAPTYERLVKLARHSGLRGATVLRGILGFGSRGVIDPSRGISLAEHAPIIVEIVDEPQRIRALVEGELDPIMIHGMLTLERAAVLMYRQRGGAAHPLALSPLLDKPLSTLPRLIARPHMQITENGVLLRIFAGESDRVDAKPLHEAILLHARQLGLSGATVLRGVEGFGANSILHKAKLLEMSTDLPIVIEIADTDEKVRTLLPYLEEHVHDGMITMEHVQIVKYGAASVP